MSERGDGQPGGFEARLARLDLSLFDAIPSQTSPNDRRSLLALQAAVRERCPLYAYLEIGSHLGGTIQPFLFDDRCERVFSIDSRPRSQPDERGPSFSYPENSTRRMLELLRAVSPSGVEKVLGREAVARDVDPASVRPRPAICFVDGEHTDRAVREDAAFCLAAMEGEGVVAFHDAPVVYNGLHGFLEDLARAGTAFVAYNLPDTVLVVEIGDVPLHRSEAVAPLLVNNHVGYLASLRANDHYRRFYNRAPFRALRSLRGILAPIAPGRAPSGRG